ncbi:SCP-like protein [Teladorsagia circumcincta]|uniref:SCP-like protein n=1 Tax=Teladorsagia circumcincta TaxID=45464 RepID=A0A2G9UH10_TELCI|nr:SCP-like protein [Teladorsagia circumcincta]
MKEHEQELNAYIAQKLNEFRQSIANGTAFKHGGRLPRTMSMFPLTTNRIYEMIAELSSTDCVEQNTVPQGVDVSMNFYSVSYLPSSVSRDTVADFALSQWEQEPYLFGIGDDVMYTNATLQEFANIVHYKTTQFGCHYKECDTSPTMPNTRALSCVFGNPSRLAQGLVPNGLSGQNAPSGQNLYKMSYSTDLESEAQKYADECPASGSSLESRNNTGENFGIVSTSSANTYYDAVVQAIRSFWHEIKITVINKEMLFTYVLTQRQKAPLRFTQMAWANTHQVGCGVNHCGDNYIVVCRYSPRGDVYKCKT